MFRKLEAYYLEEKGGNKISSPEGDSCFLIKSKSIHEHKGECNFGTFFRTKKEVQNRKAPGVQDATNQ